MLKPMFHFIGYLSEEIFEDINAVNVTLILVVFLTIVGYAMTWSKQINTNNKAVASTVILPCNSIDGCPFSGMLTKNEDTYTLTQDNKTIITFTKFVSISNSNT
ncbi:hypothetical protein [Photobacterium damselae]|uniref:hypothetical protein n=1 Tax=Photobacterium damselae TaxID=38293 RepID=UPI00110346FE|nr:hypothetical protein [Photobacterium damselae]